MVETDTVFSSTPNVSTNAKLSVSDDNGSTLFSQTKELLAEFETGTSRSSPTSSNEHVLSTKSRHRRAKEARKCREYRRIQKYMRGELRRQEEELTAQLSLVQRDQEKKKIRLEALRTPAFFVWKSFATLKMEERLYAEAEQRRLTAAVRAQAVYIDHMKTVLLKQNSIECGSQPTVLKNQRQSTERELFKYLIQECDENFLRIDQVFKGCGLDLLETEAQVKSQQRHDSDREVEFYQELMKIVQPFSHSEMSSSLWKMVQEYYGVKTDYEHCCDVQDLENTCAFSFRERISLTTGEEVFVRQRAVLRRFIEVDRVVFTWKFLSEGEGIFYGMHQEETGWCTLRPSTDQFEPGTVLAACNRRNTLQATTNTGFEAEIGVPSILGGYW